MSSTPKITAVWPHRVFPKNDERNPSPVPQPPPRAPPAPKSPLDSRRSPRGSPRTARAAEVAAAAQQRPGLPLRRIRADRPHGGGAGNPDSTRLDSTRAVRGTSVGFGRFGGDSSFCAADVTRLIEVVVGSVICWVAGDRGTADVPSAASLLERYARKWHPRNVRTLAIPLRLSSLKRVKGPFVARGW